MLNVHFRGYDPLLKMMFLKFSNNPENPHSLIHFHSGVAVPERFVVCLTFTLNFQQSKRKLKQLF